VAQWMVRFGVAGLPQHGGQIKAHDTPVTNG
jgi:hypothetical protein